MAALRNNTLAFCIALFSSSAAFCQEVALDLNKKILIASGTLSLDSVFHIAAQQTGAVFSYDANRLNVHQRVRLPAGVVTLEKILATLTETNGLCVKRLENHIIVTPCKKNDFPVVHTEILKPKQRTLTAGIRHGPRQRAPEAASRKDTVRRVLENDSTSTLVSQVDPSLPQTDTLRASTNMAEKQPAIFPSPPPRDSIVTTKAAVSRESSRTKQPLPEKKPDRRGIILFAKIGASLDESWYAGTIAQVGIPALYATLSVNTNFKVSYLQYGLGTSFQIGHSSQILLVLTHGAVERSGHYTDSVKNRFPVLVKSTLTRASAAIEISLSKKIALQIGPVFNYLKTNYYINNVQSNLSNFSRGDEVFSTISPPYFMVNTYSPTTDSNVKTWIGLQASVLYRIKF